MTTPSSRVSPQTITETLRIGYYAPGGVVAAAATARLSYDAAQPFMVSIGFRIGSDRHHKQLERTGSEQVPFEYWPFSRDDLISGFDGPVGDGDVQIYPGTGRRRGGIQVLLSHGFSARFEFQSEQLKSFLDRTKALVPAGQEVFDLDAELALLVWSDPTL